MGDMASFGIAGDEIQSIAMLREAAGIGRRQEIEARWREYQIDLEMLPTG